MCNAIKFSKSIIVVLFIFFLSSPCFGLDGDQILDNVQPEGGGTLDIQNVKSIISIDAITKSTLEAALDFIASESDPVFTAWDKDYDDLSNKPTIIDWTVDQGDTNIHAGNYTDTNTTYTAGGTLLNLTGTTFSLLEGTLTNGKYCTYITGTGLVCNSDGGSGYTNLTSFVDQTAWRLFYSDGSGDVKELAFGSDGEYLKSNGTTAAPSWATPSGASHDAVTLSADLGNNLLGLSTQELTLDTQTANYIFAGPTTGAVAAPTFRALVTADIPTLNQNTTGSAASVSISGQTGLLTFTGPSSTNRQKTIRDAADTILEMGGSYTPTGTWNWGTATVTWPTFNQNTTGTAAGLTAQYIDWNSASGGSSIANKPSIPTQYTDELAQDAIGAMINTNVFTYTDATPLLDIKTQMSITSDASGLKLSGDSASPGNSKIYGTNGSGTKGWYDAPAATMTYPGAGIPLSTGSSWGTSITNNSTNWNTAYGWGNHASAGYLTSSSTGVTGDWTINSDLDNVTSTLTFGRTTGGSAKIDWDGTRLGIDKYTTITVADSSVGMRLIGATGRLRIYPYFDSTYGAAIEAMLTSEASPYYIPLTFSSSKFIFYSGSVLINATAAIGSEKLRVNGSQYLDGSLTVAGGQISFPATQAASSNANTLDDYEEGTYDSTVSCSTSGGFTSSVNSIGYVKIGKHVHLQGLIQTTADNSCSGYVRFSIPFASANLSNYGGYSTGTAALSGHGGTQNGPSYLRIDEGVSYFYLWTVSLAGVNHALTELDVGDTWQLDFSIDYIAAN